MQIVYLCPKLWFINKLSRVRFHQIEAIGELADVTWSGTGWDNYNKEKTVEDNLLQIYSGKLPDLIICFDPLNLKGLKQATPKKCIMMNEMHAPDGNRQSAHDLMRPFDIVICHHLNEMNNPFFADMRYKFVNIPHCAHSNIFKDYEQPKTYDVLLVGELRLEKYKLRKRFIPIIKKLRKQGWKANIFNRPAGNTPDAVTGKYLHQFARVINQTKICLTCSSIYKCAFGKYVEIPMCRSLLAADLPDERHEFFKKFILHIDENKSDKEIVDKIIYYLQNDRERNRLIEAGYKLNHQKHTMQHYAEQFFEAIKPRKLFL